MIETPISAKAPFTATISNSLSKRLIFSGFFSRRVLFRSPLISVITGIKRADPWNHNMIVFKPAGKIGFIQPSIEDNELFEEDNVDYMNAGNGIRIAKWRTGESTGQKAGEYTQGSARLIPVITEINGIVCLQVRGFEEPIFPAGLNTIIL